MQFVDESRMHFLSFFLKACKGVTFAGVLGCLRGAGVQGCFAGGFAGVLGWEPMGCLRRPRVVQADCHDTEPEFRPVRLFAEFN